MFSRIGKGGGGNTRFHERIWNGYFPLNINESNSIFKDSHILGLLRSLNLRFGLCVILSIVIGIDKGIGII